MRGSDEQNGALFSYVDLEDRVTARHPLRLIRQIVNAGLAQLDADFAGLYAAEGRPSIPPEPRPPAYHRHRPQVSRRHPGRQGGGAALVGRSFLSRRHAGRSKLASAFISSPPEGNAAGADRRRAARLGLLCLRFLHLDGRDLRDRRWSTARPRSPPGCRRSNERLPCTIGRRFCWATRQ
jgi:hypothetical protein